MQQETDIIQTFNWSDLQDDTSYQTWRTTKLKTAEAAKKMSPVDIVNLSQPSESERAELKARCKIMNFAHYSSPSSAQALDATESALRGFADHMGLRLAETHRSAGASGIVALQVSAAPTKRGYIPYTSRAMNWHTDGYYNAPRDYIAGFVLHCVRPAADGGVNELLDPEIAYIRLRDRNPALLAALMHRRAMSIPENREPDGTVRAESVGPVFFADPETGRMQMRYTARTRSIKWREDPATEEAQTFLREHLSDDPLVCRLTLAAGQGILNNNILHNRTGFSDSDAAARLIYRVRFHNRVEGS